MKSQATLVLILTLCGCVHSVLAGQTKFSTGLEIEGEPVLTLSYTAQPLEKTEAIDNLLKGRLSREDLDAFNLGDKWAKVATLETKKDLTIGQIDLPAGKYPAGFNADEKGNLFFAIWVEGKAKKTQIEVKELKEAGPPFLTFLCGPAKDHSALVIVGGSHYAVIPGIISGKDKADDSGEAASDDADWKEATDNRIDGFSGR